MNSVLDRRLSHQNANGLMNTQWRQISFSNLKEAREAEVRENLNSEIAKQRTVTKKTSGMSPLKPKLQKSEPKNHIGKRFSSIERYVDAKKNLTVIENIIEKHR